MTGYYVATYGFENDENGDVPFGWIDGSHIGCSANIISELDGHKKVLKLWDGDNSGYSNIFNYFTAQTSGTVEWWWRQSKSGVATHVIIRSSASDGIVLRWAITDEMQYEDSGGSHNVKSVNPNHWYHHKIDFDCDTDTFNWSIDGVLEANNAAFKNVQTTLNNFRSYTWTTHTDYSSYIDAVGYSWSPNYNIGDNTQEGLLLIYEIDIEFDLIEYSLDGQPNQTIWGNATFRMPTDGLHSIQVYGHDSLANVYTSDVRYFSVYSIEIITPENKSYPESMSGYYPATYKFQNDLEGNEPTDWSVYEGGGTIQIISGLGGHKKVAELHDTSNFDNVWMKNNFTSQINGTIELWVRITDSTESVSFTVKDIEGGDIAFSTIIADGIIRTSDFSWLNPSDPLNPYWRNILDPMLNDTWYHLRWDFNCSNDTYDIYIDGNLKQSNCTFFNNLVNVSHILISTSDSLINNFYVYLDAIGYSWDPNYNIGDNLNEGLLLSFITINNLDWIGYSLNYQANNTILENTTIPMSDEGLYLIQVFGNNTSGDFFQSDIRYFIWNYAPIILINSPHSNSYFGEIAPVFNISVIEKNLVAMWYTIDGGITNITFADNSTLSQNLWNVVNDGLITIIFCANDTCNHIGSASISVIKDTLAPTSSISFDPYEGTNIVTESTSFTIYTSDGLGSGISVTRYKIGGETWIDYETSFNLSYYPAGDYNISYQAIDAVGNAEEIKSILVKLVEIDSFYEELLLIIIIIIIGSIAVVIFSTVMFLKAKSKPKKGQITPEIPRERVPVEETLQEVQKTDTVPSFCPMCGKKIMGEEKFCSRCGAGLED